MHALEVNLALFRQSKHFNFNVNTLILVKINDLQVLNNSIIIDNSNNSD